MPRLSTASTQTPKNAILGPGAVIENLRDKTLNGALAVLRKTQPISEPGRVIGAMTAVPNVNVAPEYVNVLEDVTGVNAVLKSAQQIWMTEVTAEMEIVELVPENLHLLMPGLAETVLENGSYASLTLGTAPNQWEVIADSLGTSGNSITLTLTAAAGAEAATTVSVAGSDIAVTLGTGAVAGTVDATIGEVVDAINAHAGASALVTAALGRDADPDTLAVAAASQTLSGGTLGVEVGQRFQPKGYISDSDYRDLTVLFETTGQPVFLMIHLNNCLSTDEIEITADDGGTASGTSLTVTAHADDTDFDSDIGVYKPPVIFERLNPPVAA